MNPDNDPDEFPLWAKALVLAFIVWAVFTLSYAHLIK